jgi:hypothetical protein
VLTHLTVVWLEHVPQRFGTGSRTPYSILEPVLNKTGSVKLPTTPLGKKKVSHDRSSRTGSEATEQVLGPLEQVLWPLEGVL